jgi:hypothetical protein
MNLSRYIQGIRKGSEINRLEREAMEDSFLAEAMDGYDKISRGEHEIRIKRMQNNITAQTRPSNSTLHHWSIVASILLIIGVAAGGYFLWTQFDMETGIEEYVIPPVITDAEKVEKSDETVADSLANQEVQMNPVTEINSKLPETVIVKAKGVTNVPNMNKLPVADTIRLTPVEVSKVDTVRSTPVEVSKNESVVFENEEQKN